MNVVKFDFRVFARSAQTNVHTYIYFSSGGSHGTTHPSEFQTSNLLRGLSEIVPTFETVFVLACHYAISKLRQGMCHHYGAWHVSPRLHIHRFRPWAPVRLPGVSFLTNACGSPIAHFERFCSPAGWICGKRASGHRGGS